MQIRFGGKWAFHAWTNILAPSYQSVPELGWVQTMRMRVNQPLSWVEFDGDLRKAGASLSIKRTKQGTGSNCA